jgi:hypothetical protein
MAVVPICSLSGIWLCACQCHNIEQQQQYLHIFVIVMIWSEFCGIIGCSVLCPKEKTNITENLYFYVCVRRFCIHDEVTLLNEYLYYFLLFYKLFVKSASLNNVV